MSEIIDDFKNTWLKVMKTPTEFFEQMPTEGGYGDPIKFAAISYLIAGIGMTLISLGMLFPAIILMPIMGVVGLFIGGLISHIFFKIVGGQGTYEGTVRLLAYVTAGAALSWIPIVGFLVAIYLIYMEIVGGTKVHKISTLSSLIAVLVLPLILAIALVILAIALVVLLGAAIAGIVATIGGMY